MKTSLVSKIFIGVAAIAVTSAHATFINISDHSFTPDGSSTAALQNTNINTLKGAPSYRPAEHPWFIS